MIDITAEETLSLAAAARLLPPGRRGRCCHLSTLVRWIKKGAKAPDGRRVVLEAARVGSRWLTSREALLRFAAALTPEGPGADEPGAALVRSLGDMRKASLRAAVELQRRGV